MKNKLFFAYSSIAIIGIGLIVILGVLKKSNFIEFDSNAFLNRTYTRGELDEIFESGITQSRLMELLGKPQAITRQNIENDEYIDYHYRFSPDLLKNENIQKIGTGIIVSFENGKIENWTITGLKIYSPSVTQDELQSKIHIGMTKEEVKRYFGEPYYVNRDADGYLSYEYFYNPKQIIDESGHFPIGFYVSFSNGKVDNMGVKTSDTKEIESLYSFK